MSGNPFRRQQQQQQRQQQQPPPPAAVSSEPPSNSSIASAPKPKGKVKRVQFVSPIASPQEPASHARFPSLEELETSPRSPPPQGVPSDVDNVDTRALLRGDLTAGGVIDLEARDRVGVVQAIPPASGLPPPDFHLGQPPPGRRGPPPNPFARAMATTGQEKSPEASDAERKPAMDVDAFKRLLLTGKVEAANTVPQDQSSNSAYDARDSSSVLPDQAGRKSPSSSTSSLEDASSVSDASTDEASSDGTLEGAAAKVSRQTPRLPEPSSSSDTTFDDFDDSSLQPATIEVSTPTVQSLAFPPRASRSGSDPGKALPHIPSAQREEPEASSAVAANTRKPSRPPPPPSARRPGQSRVRSTSDANSIRSETSQSDALSDSTRPKPPPPRAALRRPSVQEIQRPHLQERAIASTESLPIMPSQRSANAAIGSLKPKPLPPPSRLSKQQPTPPLQRASSSGSSVVPRRTSPAGTSLAPPPPPPPRRGENKQNSINGASSVSSVESRRSSGHRFASLRRDSVSSLQPVTETAEMPRSVDEAKAAAVDMLADLDAFQREVDALRARALSGG